MASLVGTLLLDVCFRSRVVVPSTSPILINLEERHSSRPSDGILAPGVLLIGTSYPQRSLSSE